MGFLNQFDSCCLHRPRGEHPEHRGLELPVLLTGFCIPQTGVIQHRNNWNLLANSSCHIWGREGVEEGMSNASQIAFYKASL